MGVTLCRLTTKAQRPGPRGRTIATATRWPGSLQRMVRLFHTPLMLNTTLTAQNDSSDPRVTGSNVAANAHHSIIPNWQRFRASTKIMPPAKQIAGVTVTVSIHNKGVADQSLLNPLVAK